MSESQPNISNTIGLSQADESSKTNALIAYGLMIAGVFTGILWFVGAIWAMVKKSEASGTIFFDHYENIIKTFWIGLVVSIVAIPLCFIFVGYFVFLGLWIWSLYKIIKGLARLTSNKSYG